MAGIIALFSSIIDQTTHISLGWRHQILFLPDVETTYYVISKFLVIFLIAFGAFSIKFPKKVKQILITSTLISIIAGVIFAIILAFMFPDVYTNAQHAFHAVAYFMASVATLSIYRAVKK